MFSITCNGGRCRVLTTLQLDGQNSLMPHFHVVALRYRLQPGDHVSYPDPPPLVFENEVARFGLEKNQLRCEMKSHVATLDEARALIDPILRNWEMEIELARGPGELRFIYENAEIIDQTPAIPGVIRGHVMVAAQEALLVSTGNLTCHITRGKYPDPPVGFHLSPDAESILLRFRGYKGGREPLLSMAYFCLTVVESAAGGRNRRSNSVKTFGIAENVLDKLGDLTTNRGDRAVPRKAHATSKPLTDAEHKWIEATIKQLVLRLCDPPPDHEPLSLSEAHYAAIGKVAVAWSDLEI